MIVPVILCGGSGTRLWPLSRNAYPKQLLPLVSANSLLQDTLLRTSAISKVTAPLVICHDDHRFLVAEQLQEMGVRDAQIILEPVGKNTAPAVAIAALQLSQAGSDPLLLILPADHVIKDTEKFLAAVSEASALAEDGNLVTFGVIPTKPETGYGYIKKAEELTAHSYKVEKFVEKPDYATAEAYVTSGEYLWNSGIFMFKASVFLAELKKYAPEMLAACEKTIASMTTDLDFIRLREADFSACPSNSIDYAVMEKTQSAVVVPLAAEWSDVGSWSALWEAHEASDEQGNVVYGDVVTEQVNNSYLRAESRMLAVVGVTDHIIVETPDVVLVAHKDNCQAVKEIVERLKKDKRPEALLHRRVHRPWGHYETIDQSTSFLVKRITVKPGASLSLQMHHHRSEHWVVVSGTAKVTRGEEVFLLDQNQSTYIPVGVKHRLENTGTVNIELIEVQSGDYLGEDDIVRFEDVYGRAAPTAAEDACEH